MCSYYSALFELQTKISGSSSAARRMDILDALSSPTLGLTEREQMAVGKSLAYFDHFRTAERDDDQAN